MNAPVEGLRIAVVSAQDPRDPRAFSGTTRSILHALEAEFGEVGVAFPRNQRALSLFSRIARKLSGGRLDPWRSARFTRAVARGVLAQLREQGADLAVCVAASGLGAEIGSHIPSVHVSDTTFALIRDFYPAFRQLSDDTALNGEALEQAAIDNAMLVAVSSPWAARSVTGHYGKDPARVLTAPWGCNFAPVSKEDVLWEGGGEHECRLLFVGIDWQRKGGDIVVDTARELAARSFPFRVDFVGARPDRLPDMSQLHFHGMLRKDVSEEAARLHALFREAGFLFLPTRQDCTPMVFAEANAYAVPAIAADVGGVAGVVQEGMSGYLLPAHADARQFADLIERLWNDRAAYQALRKSARAAYEEEFNWAVWSRRFRDAIVPLMAAEKGDQGGSRE